MSMRAVGCLQLSTIAVLLFAGIAALLTYFSGFDEEYSHAPARSLPPIPAADDDNIFWFVQISDLHISRYYDFNRSRDLRTFLGAHLPFIDPAFVLITGDLTDAKTADFHSSRQYEDEWQAYQRTFLDSGVLQHFRVLDMRGNHDGFDTPLRSGFDSMYRTYSVRKHPRQLGHKCLYVHETEFGNYSFVAVDAVPRPGPKRPFNFFGILDEDRLVELKEAVRGGRGSNHTIFYGHYPSSIITQPYSGALREVLSSGTAYLSGHLHDLNGFFDPLYTQQRSGQLELELADWKINRRYRVMAFDHDLLSFTDVTFGQFPVVVVTNPKSATFSAAHKEPLGRIAASTHIRLLVFSPRVIRSVKVWIDGKLLGQAKQASAASHLYVLPWKPSLYSQGLHLVKVEAADTRHVATVSQVFSLDGSRSHFHWFPTALLLSDLVLVFKTLYFSAWSFVTALLLTARFWPRLLCGLDSRQRVCFGSVRAGLCLVARDRLLFTGFLVFHVYHAFGPCYAGELLTDHYGFVFTHGVWVEGHYLPGSMSFFYNSIQILLFHVPLLFSLAIMLDASQSKRRDGRDREVDRGGYCGHPAAALSLALLALLLQANYCRLMWKAYGGAVLLFGPTMSWSLLAAICSLILVHRR